MGAKIERLDAIAESVTDYLSPLTIKEVRQSLKGKLFLSSFLLGIVSCLIPTIGFAASESDVLGQEAFFVYGIIMFIGVCVVFPYLAFSSLHEDRLNSTFELVGITNLNSHQLVWGKWQSSMVQVGLFVSSVMPFLTYSYFLKGISILSIVGIIIVALALSQVVNLLAILAASLSHLKSNRLTFYFVFVFILAGGGSVFLGSGASYEFSRGAFTTFVEELFSKVEYISIFSLFLCVVFSLEWFLYELAAGQLAPATSNRSSRCRYSLTLLYFFIFTAIFVGTSFEISRYPHPVDNNIKFMYMWISMIILILAVFILGESDELSQVMYKKYSKSSGLLSIVYNTFYIPGKGSGYMFLIIVVFSYLIIFTWFCTDTNYILNVSNTIVWLSAIYLMNLLPYYKFMTAAIRRTATIASLALLLFVPTMLYLFLEDMFGEILNIYNPTFFNSGRFLDNSVYLLVNLVTAIVLFVICVFTIQRSKKVIQTVRKFDAGERGATQ